MFVVKLNRADGYLSSGIGLGYYPESNPEDALHFISLMQAEQAIEDSIWRRQDCEIVPLHQAR